MEEKEIGRFGLGIKVMINNKGVITPKFGSMDINIPKEVLIIQLKSFLNILEENYKQDFKEGNKY